MRSKEGEQAAHTGVGGHRIPCRESPIHMRILSKTEGGSMGWGKKREAPFPEYLSGERSGWECPEHWLDCTGGTGVGRYPTGGTGSLEVWEERWPRPTQYPIQARAKCSGSLI